MAARRRLDWTTRRVHRSAHGPELYNYPGALAQRLFYHVGSLGRARIPAGFRWKTTPGAGVLLHYTRRGGLWFSARRQRSETPAGSACLLDYSEPITMGNDAPRGAVTWWVLFDGRDLPALFTELRADRDPVFRLDRPERFESLFNELVSLTRRRPPAGDARSFAVLAAIMAELFAVRPDRERLVGIAGRKAVLSDPVRKGIDYMARFHGQADLSLERIAAAASLSLRHFTRRFRDEVGVTPIQYLNRHRIERARELLTSTDKSIEEIARLVGTSSQSYFAHLFKRIEGVTPREFRLRAGK